MRSEANVRSVIKWGRNKIKIGNERQKKQVNIISLRFIQKKEVEKELFEKDYKIPQFDSELF